MDATDWAWAAGIIEGEGCIVSRRRGNAASLIVKMADLDVIERLGEILGCGRLTHIPSTNPRHRDLWRWEVARTADVIQVLRRIRPMMGERRGARIDEVLPQLETPLVLVDAGWSCKESPSARNYGLGCRCDGCRLAKRAEGRRAAA